MARGARGRLTARKRGDSLARLQNQQHWGGSIHGSPEIRRGFRRARRIGRARGGAGIGNGKAIPEQYTFCVPSAQNHTGPGGNKNPKISWSKGPKGTKSYAIIASDPDVPTIRADMNKEGKTLPADMPRRTFYHWVLVDIPANVTSIPEAGDSDGRVIHGKPPGPAKIGVRGINDYTAAFASNDAMKGNYGGYDGPCPPWNDLRLHHYHFAVYALDVAHLDLSGNFTGPDAEKAMKGHVLAKGETIGTYTQNPTLKQKQASK